MLRGKSSESTIPWATHRQYDLVPEADHKIYLDEVEILRNEVLAVVHDEDAADIELDVVALLLGLKEIERRALGHKQDGTELKLTLDREVLDGKVVLPIIGERLVEARVLLGLDVLWVSCPDGLRFVKLFGLGGLPHRVSCL